MACVRKYRGNWIVDYRDAYGKRHISRVDSKAQGLENLAEVTKALRQGTFDPDRAKTLFKDYAITWLQSRRGEITISTYTSYEYALRVHLLPVFGHLEIGKISRAQVRFFLGRKSEQKKANGQLLSKDSVRIFKAGPSRDSRDGGGGRNRAGQCRAHEAQERRQCRSKAG